MLSGYSFMLGTATIRFQDLRDLVADLHVGFPLTIALTSDHRCEDSRSPSALGNPAIPRHGAKDHWWKDQHLRNGRHPNTKPWNERHLRGIAPAMCEVDHDHFDEHTDHETGGQHESIPTYAGVLEPLWPVEDKQPGEENEKDQKAIAQAHRQAMPPWECLALFP